MMKTIEVVAAIIHHDGKILATQRGYGDFKDGWEFPGGKREPGESDREALGRELREELAVELRAIMTRANTAGLYVTHDHEEAFTVADRIAVVADGRIKAIGPVPVIREQLAK